MGCDGAKDLTRFERYVRPKNNSFNNENVVVCRGGTAFREELGNLNKAYINFIAP